MNDDDCLKLTTYFGERDRAAHRLVADALLDLYGSHCLQASALLRGSEGFGRLHHLHTDRLLTLSEDLPLVSLAIDARERIEAVIEPVLHIQRRGLITLERVQLLSGSHEASRPLSSSAASSTPHADAARSGPRFADEQVKLTVYMGRHEQIERKPAFRAVCELLHGHGIAGATALLGVDGTRNGVRERARFIGRNPRVPTLVIAVGDGERIARVRPELTQLLSEPLLTFERVLVCKRDGQRLATPERIPDTDEYGLQIWQKLSVYTSQSHTHRGHPLNIQIIRRLRESDAAGATSVRGIWGFHGDHAPHGDKLLQLRRHVPVVTVAVDTPQRIAAAFQIVDELTVEHGLVTCETVPAMTAMSHAEHRGGLRLAQRVS